MYSLTQENIFLKLREDLKFFRNFIKYNVSVTLSELSLEATFRDDYLRDAYELWTNDLDRIENFDLKNGTKADHLKHAGHLCYWLRRCKVISWVGLTDDHSDDEIKSWFKNNSLIIGRMYGRENEFLAIDLCYRMAAYAEAVKYNHKKSPTDILSRIDSEYISAVAHVFKTKNVSPHAIYLIFYGLIVR